MDNKFIVCLVMGAIALAAIAIFATNPTGQAMLKYATTTLPSGGASTITGTYTKVMWLGEYKTQDYNNILCKKTYKIETLIVTDTSPSSAKFKVNGETTDALYKNDAYTFVDGSKLTVLELLPKEGSESAGSDMVKISFYCPKDIVLPGTT